MLSFVHGDLMKTGLQIYLREPLGPGQLGEEVFNTGKRIGIHFGDGVQIFVVYTNMLRLVFLRHYHCHSSPL